MIDPKELRIGNRINYTLPEHNRHKAYDGTFNEEFARYLFDVRDEWVYLEPIRLTGVILEKCGFMHIPFQRGMAFINLDSSPYDNRVLEYSRSTNNIYIACSQGGEGEETNTTKMLTQIKHLHQLQNLYFALTGEELKIEL